MIKRRSRLSETLAPYLAGAATGVAKLSISLPADLAAEVRQAADERGTSVSAVVAAAVRRSMEDDRGQALASEVVASTAVVGGAPADDADSISQMARDRATIDGLVGEAVNEWFASRGLSLSHVPDDATLRWIEAFRNESQRRSDELGWTNEQVEAEVDAAVKEVRQERAARRP